MPLTPHGALPLIKQVALTERDTLINATSFSQGAALGWVQQLGFQPATLVQPAQWTRRMYKTNPSLVTGLRCKPYTRNTFDYRRLCELVLGWRFFSGKIMRNARARKHISALPKARPNAIIHYCGKSTRNCQNHVRPNPHQARSTHYIS